MRSAGKAAAPVTVEQCHERPRAQRRLLCRPAQTTQNDVLNSVDLATCAQVVCGAPRPSYGRIHAMHCRAHTYWEAVGPASPNAAKLEPAVQFGRSGPIANGGRGQELACFRGTIWYGSEWRWFPVQSCRGRRGHDHECCARLLCLRNWHFHGAAPADRAAHKGGSKQVVLKLNQCGAA